MRSILRIRGFMIGLFLVHPVVAAEIASKVLEVEPPTGTDERYLVYLEGGDVLKLRNPEVAHALEGAGIAGANLRIGFEPGTPSDRVTRIELLPASAQEPVASVVTDYEPTDLGSLDQVSPIFLELTRRTTSDSICSNRAHVWAYRMWRDHGVKSMKAFLFFTSRYIRKYHHRWWYHVTPFVRAADTQYAVDRTFMKAPRELSSWARYFVNNRFDCPSIARYSDYVRGKETGWCYVRRVPMTVWMPWGVKAMDQGAPPADFVMSQVRTAVNQALTPRGKAEFESRGW